MNLSVLSSIVGQAAAHDLEVELESTTNDEQSPYVLSYQGIDSLAGKQGYILLYPAEDLFMTSSQIGLVVKHVKMIEESGEVILLFRETALARVSNALKTTGVTKHVKIGTYDLHGDTCSVAWPE